MTDLDADLVARARALRPLIEAEAEEAEATGTTTKPVVDAIAEQQLFWTMVPKVVRRAGGADRDLPRRVRGAGLRRRLDRLVGDGERVVVGVRRALLRRRRGRDDVPAGRARHPRGHVRTGRRRATPPTMATASRATTDSAAGAGTRQWIAAGAMETKDGERGHDRRRPPVVARRVLPTGTRRTARQLGRHGARGHRQLRLRDRRRGRRRRVHVPPARSGAGSGAERCTASGCSGSSRPDTPASRWVSASVRSSRCSPSPRPSSAWGASSRSPRNSCSNTSSRCTTPRCAPRARTCSSRSARPKPRCSPDRECTLVQQQRMRQATTYATRVAADAARFAYTWAGTDALRNPSVAATVLPRHPCRDAAHLRRQQHAHRLHADVDRHARRRAVVSVSTHVPRRHDPLLVTVVALAVALAVADSSVVVLALPDLYATFDVSIVGVSWTITAYNVAIVIGALAVLPLERRVRGHVFAGIGLGLFSAASLVCGFANSFELLIAGRVLQGFGAALALAGTVPVLAGIRGSDTRALAVWGLAGSIGAAVGTGARRHPDAALQLAQHLPAAGAAGRDRARRRDRPAGAGGRDRAAPGTGRPPVLGELRVPAAVRRARGCVVPRGAAARDRVGLVADHRRARRQRPAGRRDRSCASSRPLLPSRVAAVAGGVALAGGLVALAFLPVRDRGAGRRRRSSRAGSGSGCSAACSGPPSVPPTEVNVRAATISIAARHAGFVLALAVIAPVLASQIDSATLEATRATTAEILDADIALRTKVDLALDLRDLVADAPRGEVPDPDRAVRRAWCRRRREPARCTRTASSTSIRDTLTRAFRPSFLIAALFGALAALVAATAPRVAFGAAQRRRARRRRRDHRAGRRADRGRVPRRRARLRDPRVRRAL